MQCTSCSFHLQLPVRTIQYYLCKAFQLFQNASTLLCSIVPHPPFQCYLCSAHPVNITIFPVRTIQFPVLFMQSISRYKYQTASTSLCSISTSSFQLYLCSAQPVHITMIQPYQAITKPLLTAHCIIASVKLSNFFL